MFSASNRCQHWTSVVMVQVTGLLPPAWEIWTEFLAFGYCPQMASAAAGIRTASQWASALRVSPSLCLVNDNVLVVVVLRIYLCIWKSYKLGEGCGERENLAPTDSLSKWPQWLELGCFKARILEVLPGPSCWCRGSKVILFCLLKPQQGAGSEGTWDLNWCCSQWFYWLCHSTGPSKQLHF